MACCGVPQCTVSNDGRLVNEAAMSQERYGASYRLGQAQGAGANKELDLMHIVG